MDGYVPLFERYLAERGWRQPERVVLTHRHRDHLGGVAHLRERFPGLPVAKMLWKDTDLPEGITDLRDGDRIEADGATLIAVHTPGHASDHLCYYLPEERALFSGDLILSGSTTVIPEEDGDLGQYLDSLRRVQALGVERIYSAHGPVIENAAAKIQEYIDHRLLRERQILDVARQWRSDHPGHGRDHLRRGPDDAPQDGGPVGALAPEEAQGRGARGRGRAHRRPLPLAPRRMQIRAHLLRWRPRQPAQRTESTPRRLPSGAASQLDPSLHPAPFSATP